MIKDRPKALLALPSYGILPKLPYSVDWTSVPELINLAMLDLGGVQPPTLAMVEAAGGALYDKPSAGEVELFKQRGTKFQLISIVASVIPAGYIDGVLRVKPFAITLIPSQKRGELKHSSIEFIAAIDVDEWLATEPMYTGYDPFTGEWSIFGNLNGYADGKRAGFLDQIGIVIDQFFLATETGDDEVLMMDLQMPSEEMRSRYEKHRKKLFFRPFKNVEMRRVWGVQTPIELFLLQGLANEGLFPQSQMLLMDDGTTFPALYHLWQDIEFRHSEGLITEADFYFPDTRIAVFCDGSSHSRPKQKAKDAVMNSKLEALGIHPIRVPGHEIKFDLPKAIDRVKEAIAQAISI